MKKGKGRPGISIMCINDGMIFKSLSEAAEHYGIDQTAMSRQLKGERKTAGGLHFIKISSELTEHQLEKIKQEEITKIYNIKT